MKKASLVPMIFSSIIRSIKLCLPFYTYQQSCHHGEKNILSNVTPKQTKCIPIFKYSVIILMGFYTKKFQFENQTQMYQNKWITMMLQALQIKILIFLDNQIIRMCINFTT
jgi:hypothetical protein